jgi:hypothetical protein
MAATDPIAFQLGPIGPDAAQLQRKQAMIDALLAQAQKGPQQGEMVSGHYIAPSMVSALLPALQMFAAQHAQGKVDTQKQELAQKYQGGLAQAMQQYMQTRNGIPGTDATPRIPEPAISDAAVRGDAPMPDFQSPTLPTPGTPATPGNPFQAAATAAGSSYPQIAMMGNEDLKAQLAGQLTPKELLAARDMTGGSRVAAATGGGATVLKPEVYNPVGQVGTNPDGTPIMGQTQGESGKATFAPKGVNVNVSPNPEATAGKELALSLAKGQAKTVEESFTKATSASQALDALGNATEQFDAGVKSGAAAPVQLGLAKWGKALGLGDDPQIANTESYRAAVARETAQMVKNFGSGTGISDADRQFAEKMSGGEPTLDDKSMSRLLNLAQAAAANVVTGHAELLARVGRTPGAVQEQIDSFKVPFNFKAGSGVSYDPTTGHFTALGPVPTTKLKGTAEHPMTLEEYAAKLRGGQ